MIGSGVLVKSDCPYTSMHACLLKVHCSVCVHLKLSDIIDVVHCIPLGEYTEVLLLGAGCWKVCHAPATLCVGILCRALWLHRRMAGQRCQRGMGELELG